MEYLPLFHRLDDRPVLVVGAGPVAARKIRLLLAARAAVTVVAPALCEEVAQAQRAGQLAVLLREYRSSDLDNRVLVVVATNFPEINRRVADEASSRFIAVNAVDAKELCTVIFPSIVDRSPVQIAISTAGTAPVLARLLRTQLEGLLPARLGHLAALANRFRGAVAERIAEPLRKKFWEQVFAGRVASLSYQGNSEQARVQLQQQLDTFASEQQDAPQGEVYLVGGGPGDPDLLTFKALRLMQQADIVLYDRLVSPQVLDKVRRDAELVYVGKRAGNHAVSQDNINLKLVEYAQQGLRVLRLKGGDPFIFGRGGEEIATLAEYNIPFQVVPGITAASGCASYAGIPLTHRDHAQSVRFIAGHLMSGELNLDWAELAKPAQTLVFYMGLSGMETICSQLMAHGAPGGRAAAIIEKGTQPDQRNFVADLATLPALVRAAQAGAPTLLIVGEVVRLHRQLNWYQPAEEDKSDI
ncbi:uroporphyrinogen-III C-methyltransferase [Gammaproteobacteria bacterium LSUCC0057]|uniref:Siroheme synthase n=1 Tax=Gammaproteobacteria bacterium LSUCC0057 TaxID=2559237 RepID=A0A4Y8UNT8_9GAMM|nr:uroporphyrinogen-III C-methyltransferase [Gammaproteobacteria bacterium LSUCC0057]